MKRLNSWETSIDLIMHFTCRSKNPYFKIKVLNQNHVSVLIVGKILRYLVTAHI